MRIIYATLIIGVGVIISRYLVFPYSVLPLAISGVAGFCVLWRKTRKTILKFGSLTWTREELCRHILITGDTGTGKTTSGFQPILHQLTRKVPDWGGLVLGVKGDESQFVQELFDHHGRATDVINIQIRPSDASSNWTPPHRYNLLSNRQIPFTTHAKFIVDIAASMTTGQQHAFFRPMAQIALANTSELLDELKLPVTITRAYEVLTSTETLKGYIEPFSKEAATIKQQKLAQFFQTTFINAQAYEQREAIEGTVKTFLGFLIHPDLAAVFCSDEPNTLSMSEVAKGAVITISIPQTFATERRYIQTYLKLLFYHLCLRRYDQPEHLRKDENLLVLAADEFQNIVTASEDGFSDHKVIDRIRGANAVIIAGMQSQISADPAVGIRRREVLTLNMRSRFVFRSADEKCANASAGFIGKRTRWKTSKTSKPMGMSTRTKHQAEEFFIKPTKLLRQKDHKAVIIHPSKRFTRKKIVPIDGKGQVYDWY